MSFLSSRLFAWLQRTDFYENLHREAAALIPPAVPGSQERWIDVGCGPGVLTRLAVGRGYQALGVDVDQNMIKTASRLGQHLEPSIQFETASLFELPEKTKRASVVSASSLLAVMPDKDNALDALLQCTKPGGTLLAIETTEKMNRREAQRYLETHPEVQGTAGLLLWATVRDGKSPASDYLRRRLFDSPSARRIPLLDGLVDAWVIKA